MALQDDAAVGGVDGGVAQRFLCLGDAGLSGVEPGLGGIESGGGGVHLCPGYQLPLVDVLDPFVLGLGLDMAGLGFAQAGLGLLQSGALLDVADTDDRGTRRDEIVDIHHDVFDLTGGLGGDGALVDRLDHAVEHLLVGQGLPLDLGDRKRRFGGEKRRRGGQQAAEQQRTCRYGHGILPLT